MIHLVSKYTIYNGKARDIILYEYPNGDVIPVTEQVQVNMRGLKNQALIVEQKFRK